MTGFTTSAKRFACVAWLLSLLCSACVVGWFVSPQPLSLDSLFHARARRKHFHSSSCGGGGGLLLLFLWLCFCGCVFALRFFVLCVFVVCFVFVRFFFSPSVSCSCSKRNERTFRCNKTLDLLNNPRVFCFVVFLDRVCVRSCFFFRVLACTRVNPKLVRSFLHQVWIQRNY